VVTTHQQFSNPRARSIEVLLRAGRNEGEVRTALGTLLPSSDWLLRRVPMEPSGLAWDVVLLKPMEPGAVWELTRQLVATPCVGEAEPTFEVSYAEEEDSSATPAALEALTGGGSTTIKPTGV
jgi:hypothetical protein